MLAVVSWQCNCGLNVKAMYETDGVTKIRCPGPACTVTHTVDGNITALWIKEESADWRLHDFVSLIIR